MHVCDARYACARARHVLDDIFSKCQWRPLPTTAHTYLGAVLGNGRQRCWSTYVFASFTVKPLQMFVFTTTPPRVLHFSAWFGLHTERFALQCVHCILYMTKQTLITCMYNNYDLRNNIIVSDSERIIVHEWVTCMHDRITVCMTEQTACILLWSLKQLLFLTLKELLCMTGWHACMSCMRNVLCMTEQTDHMHVLWNNCFWVPTLKELPIVVIVHDWVTCMHGLYESCIFHD